MRRPPSRKTATMPSNCFWTVQSSKHLETSIPMDQAKCGITSIRGRIRLMARGHTAESIARMVRPTPLNPIAHIPCVKCPKTSPDAWTKRLLISIPMQPLTMALARMCLKGVWTLMPTTTMQKPIQHVKTAVNFWVAQTRQR